MIQTRLPIPPSVLNAHCAVLGKTGAGKSSVMRLIVEDLLNRGKRVCIIDPKGDWYGLKLGADGRLPGYPVIAFGDFVQETASDVPINEHSGRHVAELISTGNRPCVIGFRGWMPARMTKFWIEFASTLFNSKSGELYVVIDEVHNFAPKGKVFDVEAGKSLHWTNRLMSEGRGLGLVILVASQRPQKVHNDTLTCCEALFAMRVVHAADRSAIEDWIDGCGDPQHGKAVLSSVAALERGEAFVWCPEAKFGPQRIQFPMFKTFDSFAPPQLQKKISAAGWAGVDLDAVREKLAAVIAEAQANDPSLLKRQLAEARKEIKKLRDAPAPKLHTVKVHEPMLTNGQLERIEKIGAVLGQRLQQATTDGGLLARVQMLCDKLAGAVAEVTAAVKLAHQPLPSIPMRPTPVAMPTKQTMQAGLNAMRHPANGSIGKAERRILTALKQNHPEPLTKRRVALLAVYAVSGGAFCNALGKCRSLGYVVGSDRLSITDAGMEAVGEVDPLPTGPELASYWMGQPVLGRAEREILRVLLDTDRPLTKQEVAERTTSNDGAPYEASGGAFCNALGRLRTLELVGGDGNAMEAAPELRATA